MKTSVSADGTSIAWYDLGGDGPDLLLAHATGFCGEMWAPVVEAGLGDRFRCVAYDVRGHGASDRPSGGLESWDWHRYAEDAASVITAAAMSSPFGVGHSCGGATQILLEEEQPGTFRALYLFEPVIFPVIPPAGPDPDRELAVRTRRRRPSFASRQDALDTFSSRGPFAALASDALEAYVDHGFSLQPDGSVVLRCRPDDEANVYVMASDHDAFVRLPDVQCPATIAHGSQSTSFGSDDMRAVAARLPKGSFVEWPDFGHFGPLEDPKAFATAVVAAFLPE